jgi:hypothetical protein
MRTREATSSLPTPAACGPERCPLCGQPNDCQLCTTAAYKDPCWCEAADIPDELLARVPTELRRNACICRACVARFHEKRADNSPQPVLPGDFYFDPGGMMVFTAAYHLRRGHCCASGCRHCPYPEVK